MLVYQEQSASGFQEEDFDTKVEDEYYVTKKLDMQNKKKRIRDG